VTIRPVVVAAIALEFFASMVFWLLWSSGMDRAGFAAVGLLISIMTQLPFISHRHSLFSIWGMVAFAVTLGSGVRGILIAVGYPSREFVDSFFLGGATFDGLFGSSMVSLASVGLAAIGYVLAAGTVRHRPDRSEKVAEMSSPASIPEPTTVTPKGSKLSQPPAPRATWLLHSHAPEGYVVLLAALYAGIGTIAMYAYTVGVGGLGGSISQRRGTVAADGTSTGTYGYLEFLSEASTIGAIILLAYWLSTREHLGVLRMSVLAAFFVDALALNWVTTTRSDVVYLAAALFAVIHIVGGRISALGLVAAGMAVLLAIGVLTANRSSSEDDGNGFSVAYGLNSGLLNRNGYDLGKSIRIVAAVPDVLPYENGATIAVFALAPIPRSIWPDKPIISPGREIGQELYGATQSGVPPGMTGELVWNFGTLAALVLSLLIGLGLGFLERWLRPIDPKHTAMVVFYAIVLFTLGKNIFGVSIGQAITAAVEGVMLLVPAAVLTRLVTHSLSQRTAGRAVGSRRRRSRLRTASHG
jgi:hypothetical protein